MKTHRRDIVLFAAVLLCSCVSSKKYDRDISGCRQELNVLQADYAKVQKEKGNLELSLVDRDQALKNEARNLDAEKKQLEDMKAIIDAQKDAIRNLHQEVCSALKCFTPDELKIDVRNGKLYVSMSDKLLFASGSDVLEKRGQEAIAMLSAVLANSDLEVIVEGHTDAVPISNLRNKDNWDLSSHRATSVSRIMIENKIKPERIMACGRGEYHPIADNDTPEGKQQNRRTEIILAPKLDKLWKLTEPEQEVNKSTSQR